jgi:hypothetical protein
VGWTKARLRDALRVHRTAAPVVLLSGHDIYVAEKIKRQQADNYEEQRCDYVQQLLHSSLVFLLLDFELQRYA